MGNLLSTNQSRRNIYEPFVNTSISPEEQVRQLVERNRLLEEEIRSIRREFDGRVARVDAALQIKYNELVSMFVYNNEKMNVKINVITQDLENLLNNDKIMLDKLIEKNIVSTIQEEEEDREEDEEANAPTDTYPL